MLRALPAGLLLLVIVRRLPRGIWWMLFITAYRLPGGVAAIQPLFVIALSRLLLGSPIRSLSIVAAMTGISSVALLILTPTAALDPIGIVAGIGGALSMAIGTVLSRRWRPEVSPLTFTGKHDASGLGTGSRSRRLTRRR